MLLDIPMEKNETVFLSYTKISFGWTEDLDINEKNRVLEDNIAKHFHACWQRKIS